MFYIPDNPQNTQFDSILKVRAFRVFLFDVTYSRFSVEYIDYDVECYSEKILPNNVVFHEEIGNMDYFYIIPAEIPPMLNELPDEFKKRAKVIHSNEI